MTDSCTYEYMILLEYFFWMRKITLNIHIYCFRRDEAGECDGLWYAKYLGMLPENNGQIGILAERTPKTKIFFNCWT